VPDPGRAFDAGPRAHVHRDSAPAPGGLGDGVSEREERDCGGAIVRERTKLYRGTLTGARYAVSTVGFELEQVRQYIREQEGADGTGGEF